MRYLFIDLEFASSNGGTNKICEFGYVITNENFEVLDKNNFIINPDLKRSEWDYRVVKKILTRSIKEYETNPTFLYFYKQIKDLIMSADYVIGHSTENDVKAINDDCRRFDLPSINYDFYDIRNIYSDYSNTSKNTGVVEMLSALNIKGEDNIHDAATDAYNTMLELEKMVKELECSFEELIELCPKAKDRTDNYCIESAYARQKRKDEEFEKSLKDGGGSNDIIHSSVNHRRYHQFVVNVKVSSNSSEIFKDQIITLARNYEVHHYRQCLNLAQLITNASGTFMILENKATLFVKYDQYDADNNLIVDEKYKNIAKKIEEGQKIQVIDFDELLNMLKITEEELDAMPMPSFDFLFEDGVIINNNNDKQCIERYKRKQLEKHMSEKPKETSTIGDLFASVLNKYR